MQLTDKMTYSDLGKGQLVHKAFESNIHQFSGVPLRLTASFYLEKNKRDSVKQENAQAVFLPIQARTLRKSGISVLMYFNMYSILM